MSIRYVLSWREFSLRMFHTVWTWSAYKTRGWTGYHICRIFTTPRGERESVCVWERECVFVRERESDREREKDKERGREKEKERERERERQKRDKARMRGERVLANYVLTFHLCCELAGCPYLACTWSSNRVGKKYLHCRDLVRICNISLKRLFLLLDVLFLLHVEL